MPHTHPHGEPSLLGDACCRGARQVSTSQSCSGLCSGGPGLSGLLLPWQDNHRLAWTQRGPRYRLNTSDHLCDQGKPLLFAASGLGESRVGYLRLPEITRDRCVGCPGLAGLRQFPFLGSRLVPGAQQARSLTHRSSRPASHPWASPAFEGRTGSQLPRRACPPGGGLG